MAPLLGDRSFLCPFVALGVSHGALLTLALYAIDCQCVGRSSWYALRLVVCCIGWYAALGGIVVLWFGHARPGRLAPPHLIQVSQTLRAAENSM